MSERFPSSGNTMTEELPTPDRPPRGLDEFLKGFQADTSRVRTESNQAFQKDVNNLFASGELGYRPPEGLVGEAGPFEAKSGEANHFEPVSTEMFQPIDRGNQSASAGPESSPNLRQSRIIYHEGLDGEPLSRGDLEARQAMADAEARGRGEPTTAEQYARDRQAFMEARAERDKADAEFIASVNSGLWESTEEKYGRDRALAILRGEADVPHYTGGGGEEPVFTHASTGEVSLAEVKQAKYDADFADIVNNFSTTDTTEVASPEIGQDSQDKIDEEFAKIINGLEGLGDKFVGGQGHTTELADTEAGLKITETGQLDSTRVTLVLNPEEGTVDGAYIEITGEDGEQHDVGVVKSDDRPPKVTFDEVPATPEELSKVSELVDTLSEMASAERGAGRAVDMEESEPVTPEVAKEVVDTNPVPEPAPERSKVEDRLIQHNKSQEQKRSNRVESPQELEKRSAMRYAVNLVNHYPEIADVFDAMNIDPTKLRPEDIQVTTEELDVMAEQLNEAAKNPLLKEYGKSDLGKAGEEARQQLKDDMRLILRKMFDRPAKGEGR